VAPGAAPPGRTLHHLRVSVAERPFTDGRRARADQCIEKQAEQELQFVGRQSSRVQHVFKQKGIREGAEADGGGVAGDRKFPIQLPENTLEQFTSGSAQTR